MNSTANLTWFARHELTLAWRDWAQMMAGGRTTRETYTFEVDRKDDGQLEIRSASRGGADSA